MRELLFKEEGSTIPFINGKKKQSSNDVGKDTTFVNTQVDETNDDLAGEILDEQPEEEASPAKGKKKKKEKK